MWNNDNATKKPFQSASSALTKAIHLLQLPTGLRLQRKFKMKTIALKEDLAPLSETQHSAVYDIERDMCIARRGVFNPVGDAGRLSPICEHWHQ